MITPIVWFHEDRATDIALTGGKGANLGKLAAQGFPVPPGFIISTPAYKTFFEKIDLKEELQQLERAASEELGTCCAAIQDKFKQAELPVELAETILLAHEKLVAERGSAIACAVRSSATAEDMGEASFAGQHGTYYYVEAQNLLRMVKNCWASLWNQEAVYYRRNHSIDHVSVYMAIVVQEMIRSEISGITFTANPVNGAKEEIVTESCWGMGAAIVDGRVTPDRYIIARENGTLREHRIAEKKFMVPAYLDPGTKGRLTEVPHELRRKETLSSELLKTIVEWSIKAEAYFTCPQDVEWAITDGQFYMLQSRPITVLGRSEIGRDIKGKHVLFKPIVENFMDPLTPFSADLYKRFFPGIISVQGWLYVNLAAIHPLFPFKMTDAQIADFMYLGAESTTPQTNLAFAKLPLAFLIVLYGYLVFGPIYARTRSLPDDFMESFRTRCRQVEADLKAGLFETAQHLMLVSELAQPIGNAPLLVNFASVRYIAMMHGLKLLVRRWTPNVRADAESLLWSGSEGVMSTEMGRGIWDLAREARRCEQVRELLLNQKPEKVLAALQAEPAAQEFLEHLNRFLSKNGHRGLKELELKSVRWEEDPAPLFGMIRNYLLVESEPIDHEQKAEQARVAVETEIRRKLEIYPLERTFGLRWRLIRYLARQIKYFAKVRENSRFYHTMAAYFIRRKVLQLEAAFILQGRLKCKDDIFFMTWQEVLEMEAGTLDWSDVEDRVRERRLEYVRASKLKPPKTIGVELPEHEQHTELGDDTEGTVLRGQTASPGNYEGIAHVILDPSVDAELHPGEILVAPFTDPAWTPLFLTAGAAVVEVGSYLSHAGTIAREYGLPCVVDVVDCTTRIQTGDSIRVDGERGVVVVMKK